MFFHSGLFSSSAHHHAPPRDPEFRVLTKQTLNKHVLEAQYAVRGAIPLRAEELREQIEEGKGGDLPFDEVVSCNIGNPQQLDQKPLTFLRQVSTTTSFFAH
jgi:alanine transaminase